MHLSDFAVSVTPVNVTPDHICGVSNACSGDQLPARMPRMPKRSVGTGGPEVRMWEVSLGPNRSSGLHFSLRNISRITFHRRRRTLLLLLAYIVYERTNSAEYISSAWPRKPWPAVRGDAADRSRENCSSFNNGLRESLSQGRGSLTRGEGVSSGSRKASTPCDRGLAKYLYFHDAFFFAPAGMV